ncbi:MAG: hypothetical protein RL300_1629 [Pseudomonadota bacterium]
MKSMLHSAQNVDVLQNAKMLAHRPFSTLLNAENKQVRSGLSELKILVSVVRFRPGPPNRHRSSTCYYGVFVCGVRKKPLLHCQPVHLGNLFIDQGPRLSLEENFQTKKTQRIRLGVISCEPRYGSKTRSQGRLVAIVYVAKNANNWCLPLYFAIKHLRLLCLTSLTTARL